MGRQFSCATSVSFIPKTPIFDIYIAPQMGHFASVDSSIHMFRIDLRAATRFD